MQFTVQDEATRPLNTEERETPVELREVSEAPKRPSPDRGDIR